MESYKRVLKSIIAEKKGVLGLDTAKAFIITLLTLMVVAIAFVIAVTTINSANISPAGSAAANITNAITMNATNGISSLFSNATTWFVLIGVVILIFIITVLIVAVNRFGGNEESTTGA